MQERKEPGASHGEKRHRFGKTIDRGAPVLAQQQQDRRDQRAGMADADPPDEVDDGETPRDRDVDAPDADAVGQQMGDRDRTAASSARNDNDRNQASQPLGVRRVRTIALILSVTEPEVCPARSRRSVARRGLLRVTGSVTILVHSQISGLGFFSLAR